MNVVIYARFSSHRQNETSLEAQILECEKFCERNNYNIIGVCEDEAVKETFKHAPARAKAKEEYILTTKLFCRSL